MRKYNSRGGTAHSVQDGTAGQLATVGSVVPYLYPCLIIYIERL